MVWLGLQQDFRRMVEMVKTHQHFLARCAVLERVVVLGRGPGCVEAFVLVVSLKSGRRKLQKVPRESRSLPTALYPSLRALGLGALCQ